MLCRLVPLSHTRAPVLASKIDSERLPMAVLVFGPAGAGFTIVFRRPLGAAGLRVTST